MGLFGFGRKATAGKTSNDADKLFQQAKKLWDNEDYKEAYSMFMKAAGQEEKKSLYYLGMHYLTGKGVDAANALEAAMYFKEAVLAGNEEARQELTKMGYEMLLPKAGSQKKGGIPNSLAQAYPKLHMKRKMEDARCSLKAGDSFTFGRYNDHAMQWQVLERKGNQVLLQSECLLDKVVYATYKPNTSWHQWEGSDLRKWLNQDFYHAAFSGIEKAAILTANTSSVFSKPGSGGDKVFALSIDEELKYYGASYSPQKSETTNKYGPFLKYEWSAKASQFDGEQGINGTRWWLRNTGYSYLYVIVNEKMSHDQMFINISFDITVEAGKSPVYSSKMHARPAIWLDLNA